MVLVKSKWSKVGALTLEFMKRMSDWVTFLLDFIVQSNTVYSLTVFYFSKKR